MYFVQLRIAPQNPKTPCLNFRKEVLIIINLCQTLSKVETTLFKPTPAS